MVDDATDADARALLAGEGETFWFLRNRITIKATAATTGGAYGLIESHVAPGFSPPLHVHHNEDEAFWVLEGNVTIAAGIARSAPGRDRSSSCRATYPTPSWWKATCLPTS